MGTLPDTTLGGEESLEQAHGLGCRLALVWLFPRERSHILESGTGPWRIGRDPGCSIAIEDRSASREHAEISFKGPLVLLRDLASTNGTFVNARPIECVPIQPGSVVRIGQCVGVLSHVPLGEDWVARFGEVADGHYAGPGLRRVLAPLERAAPSDLPILLQGATGTGKERVAEFIHGHSGRSGPFHPINCASIPAETADSQLFGHRRGAFTGAREDNAGHFRSASGGTLFLDEVAELPLPVQAKLLRVLQERKVTALGSTLATPVDVRIVAACQEPLERAVERGTFRADLLARLRGLVVQIPPLSQRIEEVPSLFGHFLDRHSGGRAPRVEGKLIERLCLYDWPANVRELELLARQLLVLHGHESLLRRAHLPDPMRDAEPSGAEPARAAGAEPELDRLARALHEASGNITRASARLGISRARAYRLLAGESIERLLARYPRGPRESSIREES